VFGFSCGRAFGRGSGVGTSAIFAGMAALGAGTGGRSAFGGDGFGGSDAASNGGLAAGKVSGV
jgi:hypothetical protein